MGCIVGGCMRIISESFCGVVEIRIEKEKIKDEDPTPKCLLRGGCWSGTW